MSSAVIFEALRDKHQPAASKSSLFDDEPQQPLLHSAALKIIPFLGESCSNTCSRRALVPDLQAAARRKTGSRRTLCPQKELRHPCARIALQMRSFFLCSGGMRLPLLPRTSTTRCGIAQGSKSRRFRSKGMMRGFQGKRTDFDQHCLKAFGQLIPGRETGSHGCKTVPCHSSAPRCIPRRRKAAAPAVYGYLR